LASKIYNIIFPSGQRSSSVAIKAPKKLKPQRESKITRTKVSKDITSYLSQHECESMDAVWPTHKKTDEKQSITA